MDFALSRQLFMSNRFNVDEISIQRAARQATNSLGRGAGQMIMAAIQAEKASQKVIQNFAGRVGKQILIKSIIAE